jgi:hypothetical protein
MESCQSRFLFLFFCSRRFELRALNLVDRHSTTWAMPSTLFILFYFISQRGSGTFCLGPALGCNPPTSVSCVAEITDVHSHALPSSYPSLLTVQHKSFLWGREQWDVGQRPWALAFHSPVWVLAWPLLAAGLSH